MITPQIIRVPERGSTNVSSTVWKELSRSTRFWSLVERKVVSIERLHAECSRLYGGCYVGRATISDDLVLEIHEKVPGSLVSLLHFASGADFRVQHIPGPRSELGSLVALLIVHFVDAVRQYAARGRHFRYVKEHKKGSLIGGRLDVTRTIGIWSRGLRHLAAFERNVVSFDLPINRVVCAGFREIERIGKIISLPPGIVASARAMAILFDDCQKVEILFGTRADATKQAAMLASAASDKVIGDMLGLAAILLSHESFEHGLLQQGAAPRSWFLNLETLFERAVRETLKAALGTESNVSSGRANPLPIFPSTSDLFSANPDLVLRWHGMGRTVVGDVKYKQLDNFPSASDIYQLLVHASAFESKVAFLVFPFDRFEARILGNAVTGTCVKIYGLDIRELDSHIRRLLEDLRAVQTIDTPTTGCLGAA